MFTWTRKIYFGILVCVVTFALASALTERILRVPLFEVGELWYRAFLDTQSRVVSVIASIPQSLDFNSWTTYLFLTVSVFFGYVFYRLFFVPSNRVRKLGDIGYITDGVWTSKEMANLVQKGRATGDIPPVYPNGWFGLIESHRLKKGESMTISVLDCGASVEPAPPTAPEPPNGSTDGPYTRLSGCRILTNSTDKHNAIMQGLNLAMFRDDRGEAHVLDGYCPHMGANLGAGGQVVGDCIECPFHGWLFRGHDGKCTKIPYADKVPDIAKVKAWPSLEVNGWIYLWHHAEDIEPTWKPPEMEEITNGTWVFRGRSEHIINAHIEEIPENGADVYHLKEVHGPSMFAGTDLRYMWSKFWGFTQHQWKAKWEANPAPEGHIGTISLTHELELFGKSLPGLTMHVTGRQIGPGIVYLMFDTFFGKGVYIQALTPVEPMVQKLVHNIYVHWAMPAVYAKFLLHAEAIQVERDIMIWNNKKYEARPMFVKAKEDSLIAKHRRWFSQFYSEHSPRLKFKKETLEW